MSDGVSEEMVTGEDEDDTFIWQDYLEVTNSVEAPCVIFSHVEQSLLNGLEEGMILEVPLKDPDQFWLGTIIMACGPLLRMRYVGLSEDRKHEFWCDLTKVVAHPVGWCKSQGKNLTPPPELKDITDYDELLKKAINDAQPAPAELLQGEGLIPVDRIKPGMKLEVQDESNPYHLWLATVVQNVGGRLLLQYEAMGSPPPSFWLFYTSPRIFKVGWVAEKGSPWVYAWPSSMSNKFGDEERDILIEQSKDYLSSCAFPSDLIQEKKMPLKHEFEEGMRLEALHPVNMTELCPATVVKVFDSHYFLVQIDTCEGAADKSPLTLLCTNQHPYIFPIGWTKSHDLDLPLATPEGWSKPFNWTEYLSTTNSSPAPTTCFCEHTVNAQEIGFEPGMKLEAVNPENHSEICVATVNKVSGHLLWISLESNESTHACHIVSADSTEIFPVGWCEGNAYPLKPPRFYEIPAKVPSDTERCDTKEGSISSSPPLLQRSSWCPKIYFNHKCFSGPFLSKSKLALLPKSVGPGPVTLVMHEVLSKLISVAYLSNRVLRVLQADDETDRGSHLEVFKAKRNNHVYRANIAVVTSADKVPEFCRSICKRLQICPHLFGPTEISVNNCPEKCHTLSKTRFSGVSALASKSKSAESEKGQPLVDRIKNKTRKQKKRKKMYNRSYEKSFLQKKIEQPQNADTQGPPITQEDFASLLLIAEVKAEDGRDNKPSTAASAGNVVVTTNSSINSASGIKRKYKKRVVPNSDIQTRGAKLPKYTTQWIKTGAWKKQEKTNKTPSKMSPREPSDSQYTDCPRIKRKYIRRKPLKPIKLPRYTNAIHLRSNPLHWSEMELSLFLRSSRQCSHIAPICRKELIDGHSFMLLNFPTVQEHLNLNLDDSLNLCNLVQEVKFAFHIQYVINNEP